MAGQLVCPLPTPHGTLGGRRASEGYGPASDVSASVQPSADRMRGRWHPRDGLVTSLESACHLFSRLYVASQFRDVNLNDYFSNENQPCPPSVSARGKLKLGTKSDIVRCIEDASEK